MPAGLVLVGMIAVAGGIMVAAQGPIYARLSAGLNHDPLAGVFLAFLSATVATGLLALGFGNWRSIAVSSLSSLPAWVWVGGLLGACQVVISMHAIPLLGATVFLVLVITGNMIGATAYDHFGAFGLMQRPFTLTRMVGLLLVLAGVVVSVRG